MKQLVTDKEELHNGRLGAVRYVREDVCLHLSKLIGRHATSKGSSIQTWSRAQEQSLRGEGGVIRQFYYCLKKLGKKMR